MSTPNPFEDPNFDGSVKQGTPNPFADPNFSGRDGALVRGAKTMSKNVGISAGLVSGDTAETAKRVAELDAYSKLNPKSKERQALGDAFEKGDGFFGGLKGALGQVGDNYNKAGSFVGGLRSLAKDAYAMGEAVVEQTPNMLLPTAGMVAGGAAGSTAGPVGTVVGAFTGGAAGNTMVEGGSQVMNALAKANINPSDTAAVKAYLDKNGDKILGQSAVKGSVLGAVDVATAGFGHGILNAPIKEATGRALKEMGVDMADKAAVKAAMNSPAMAERLGADAILKQQSTGLRNIGRNAGAAALEPAGEFTGEFVGQGLATGDWDTKGAGLEALSSIGQSGAMYAGQKAVQFATAPNISIDNTQPQSDGTQPPVAPATTPVAPPEATPPAVPTLGQSLTGTPMSDLMGGGGLTGGANPLQAGLSTLTSNNQMYPGMNTEPTGYTVDPETGAIIPAEPVGVRQVVAPSAQVEAPAPVAQSPVAPAPAAPALGESLTGTPVADMLDTRTPSQRMGLNPAAGGLTAAAAIAVDSGASPVTAGMGLRALSGLTEVTPIERTAGQIGTPRRLGESPIIDVQAREVSDPELQGQQSRIGMTPRIGFDQPQGAIANAAQTAKTQQAAPQQQGTQSAIGGVQGGANAMPVAEGLGASSAPAVQGGPIPAVQVQQGVASQVTAGSKQSKADNLAALQQKLAGQTKPTPTTPPAPNQQETPAAEQEKPLPPSLSAKLQEAHRALGRDVTRSQVQRMRDSVAREVETGTTNNGGVIGKLTPKAVATRREQLQKLDADLALFDGQQATPAPEAGPTNQGATNGQGQETLLKAEQPTGAAAMVSGAPVADSGAFDSAAWNKSRDDTIKESKKAGNKHLDDLPKYVESMRGKKVYYAHDPKVTGTVRTVDNRGNVYIDWADEYSASKESASPVVEGKKTVMRSVLGSTDLRDYVVGTPAKKPSETTKPGWFTEKARKAAKRNKPKTIEEADDAVKMTGIAGDVFGGIREEAAQQANNAKKAEWATQFTTPSERLAASDISRYDGEKLSQVVDSGRVTLDRANEMIDSAVSSGWMVKDSADRLKRMIAPVAPAQDAAPAQPFKHAGLNIRQNRIKIGDAVEMKWIVQSPENAELEAAGKRQIGGDSVVDTRERAIETAEAESKKYAETKASKAAMEAEEASAKAKAEESKAANRGKSIIERRKDAILGKPSTVGSGTKREVIEAAVRNGQAFVEAMVFDSAAKKRDREAVDKATRANYILGLSNENIPVVKAAKEAQDRLTADKYEKPEYRMYSDSRKNGPFREISKTEYDYAQELIAKGVAQPEPTSAPTPAKATHQDPGEKPEPVTPAVVTESLKSAARKEDVKPGDMKTWLLDKIDQALKQTTDYGDYQVWVKQDGEKEAEKMWTGNGPFGKGEPINRLTFDVPGDGTFKVRNNVRGLLEFRRSVEQSKGFSNTKARPANTDLDGAQKGSGGKMNAILNMIEEGDFEAARDYAEAVGVSLDAVKPPKGDRAVQWAEFRKNGTLPPPPDTKPRQAPKTAAQLNEDARADDEAGVDYKGFNRISTGNGSFELSDGNLTVIVTPTGRDKFQASFRGAKSSPHLQGEQGAVDWASQYRADGSEKKKSDKLATPEKMTSRKFDGWIRERATIQTEQFKGDRNHGGGDEGVGYIHLSGRVESGGTNWAGTARGQRDNRDSRLIFRTDDNTIVWYDDDTQHVYQVEKDDPRLEITRPEPQKKTALDSQEVSVTVDGTEYTVMFDEPLATIGNQAFQDNLDEYGLPGAAKAEFRKLRASAQSSKPTPPKATELTPKQFHEAKLAFIAADTGASMADVRENYDTEAGRAENDREWAGQVELAANAGEVLTSKTLDKLYKLAPNVRLPETAIPQGYQRPEARKAEAEDKQARVNGRKAAKAGVKDAAPSFTDLEKELQAQSHATELDGDIGIVAGGGVVRYVSLEDAAAAAKKAIESGVRPVAFQILDATGIRIGDVDRVLGQLDKKILDAGRAQVAASATTKMAKYDNEAKLYGYTVDASGAIFKGEKKLSPVVKESKGRLRVESPDGKLLFSGAQTGEAFGEFLKSFWNAEKVDTGNVIFSRDTESPRTPAATIRAAITKAYGNLLDKLEAKGLVTIAQTEREAIEAAAQARADKTGGDVEAIAGRMMSMAGLDVKYSANGNIEGFFDKQTGKSFLVADNLTEASAPGTLMHEVGIHMAADGKLEPLFKRAGSLLKTGTQNEFIQRVKARMARAGETSDEEAAAYIVTEYENDRAKAPITIGKWLADLTAAVRAWLFSKGIILKADQLTVADIAAVARANARSMARGGPNGGLGGGQAFSRNVGDAAPDEVQRVQAAIEGKSLIEAAMFLTRSSNKANAAIAQKVAEKLKMMESIGVDLKLHIVHRGDMAPAALANSRGYTESGFDSKGSDVAVWLNGADVAGKVGTEEEVLLHELVHAATTGMVHYGAMNPDTQAGRSMKDLMAVTDAIADHIKQRFADAEAGKVTLTEFELDMREGANNAFRSDDEVLAWALSNAEAQQYLEGIPYKSGSLWSNFVRSVRALLGMSPEMDTALSEVLRVAERLLTDDPAKTGRSAFWHKRGLRMIQQQGRGSIVQTQTRTALPATLNIDGKDRPTTNSNGQPIHPTEEGVRNFWKWFADSRVVDEQGRPLVVYHGTASDVDMFDAKKTGSATKAKSADGVFWFSDSAELAEDYAGFAKKKFGKNGARNIMPVYLQMSDPKIVDMGGKEYRELSFDFGGFVQTAKKGVRSGTDWVVSPKDGVILRNFSDTPSGRRLVATHYAVFLPTQIKSATGNTGAFSPTDPDIRFSRGGGIDNADMGTVGENDSPSSQWDAPLASSWDDKIYKLQDKNIDTKRVIQAIKKMAGDIQDKLNVYLQEELYHGRTAKRVLEFGRGELNPALDELAAMGYSIPDLEEYMHARHAPEANVVLAARNPTREMIDTARAEAKAEIKRLKAELSVDGLGKDEAKALKAELKKAEAKLKSWTGVAAFKGTEEERNSLSGMKTEEAEAYFRNLPSEDAAKLKKVAEKMDAIMAETSGMMVAYHLESQETVDGWNAMYRHYIPLHRDGKDDGSMGTGQGFSIKGREVKGRTGSKRKVVNIVAHIAEAREKTIVRGEKNRIAQALVGLVTKYPNADFWKTGAPPSERVFDRATGKVKNQVNPAYKSLPNVVMAKVMGEDGKVKEVAVTFNEGDERAVRMAGALKNLDTPQIEGWLGTVSKATRYFAAVNTQFNPIFGAVNIVRDVQGAMINLGATPLADQKMKIARDTVDALAGIYRDIRATRRGEVGSSKWSELYEQFQHDGGQTGFRNLFETTDDRSQELKDRVSPTDWAKSPLGRIMSANGKLTKQAQWMRDGWAIARDWLSDYNETMESATRLAVYKAALDKGMTREQAASMAKNITVNFNRKGTMGTQAGALYAFFNAAMQGTARMGETLVTMEPGKPKTMRLSAFGKKVVYGGIVLGAVQALALAAGGFGDEEPPDFERERNLLIPTGWTGVGPDKGYIKIPMPLGLHVIPGIGRMGMEFALSGGEDPAKAAIKFGGMMADAFNPIGNAGLSMQTIAPTVLDPLAALVENKDWTGKNIARESFNKDAPMFSQHKDSATLVAKFLAELVNYATGGNEYVGGALNWSPDQIDYLIGQVTGGVGRELSKVEQTATGAFTGDETPIYKVPLLGRFAGSASGKSGEANAFYTNADKLNRLETELKGMVKDGKSAAAAALRMERPESRMIVGFNMAERQVQKLRKQKSALIEAGASAADVRAVDERITAIMQNMNQRMLSVAGN